MAELGEVCQIVGGGTPSRDVPDYFGGDIPWATPTDVTGLEAPEIIATKETITAAGLAGSSAKLLPVGSVLLTSRATIGFTAVTRVPMATNQGFANLIPGGRITAEFLAHWLPTQKATLLQLAGGTTFKEISKGNLRGIKVPLPPLDEQRRIVDLLNRAAGIRRLREAALSKARDTIPALFLSMFGDPATNPMGWPMVPLGDLVSIKANLELPRVEREPLVPCFGPEAIESGTGAVLARTSVSEAAPRSAKFRYQPGDVIYSKIRPYLAKAMLAEDAGFVSADMYPLTCGPMIRPSFLWRLLLTSAFTAWAVSKSSRAQMPKLNRETLFGYATPVPHLRLQEQFDEGVAQLHSIIAQQQRALAAANELEAALLHRLLD